MISGSQNANSRVRAFNFAMKPIGDAVHGFDPPMSPADIAGQSSGLLVKSSNIGNQSGDKIPRFLTISTLLRLIGTRIFVLLPVNGASR